jgi:hypothetical protein
VPGVGDRETAVRGQQGAKAGSEAVVSPPIQVSVQAVEHLGGSEIFLPQRAGSAHDERAQHGCAQALAAHVPYEDEGSGVMSGLSTIRSELKELFYLWRVPCRAPVGCQAGVPSSHWLSVICSMWVPS